MHRQRAVMALANLTGFDWAHESILATAAPELLREVARMHAGALTSAYAIEKATIGIANLLSRDESAADVLDEYDGLPRIVERLRQVPHDWVMVSFVILFWFGTQLKCLDGES